MIVSIILKLVVFLISGLLLPFTFLPDVTLPSGVTTALGDLSTALANISAIFPVSDLLTALGILLGVELAIFGYRVIMWIIKRIPTQS